MKMEVWALQCIRNPLIQIFTCSGTATTQCQLNIVWLALFIRELKPYVPTLNCYNRKKNIYRKHSRDVNILHGLWTELRSSPKAQPAKTEEIPQKLAKIAITKNHTWCYLIIEDWARAWRKYAADMECKYILKETTPSRTSWWPQKTKIKSWRRVGTSIDINVIGWIVMRNTLENPQGCLERGSKNIRRHPPQYLTILTPLVIILPLIILV